MSFFTAIILGIVQGVAEFLPISSSGHLSILQNILNLSYSEEGHLLFDVLLHIGTLVSICVYYRADLANMIQEALAFVRGEYADRYSDSQPTGAFRLIIMIIIGTLPLFAAIPLFDKVESLYYKTGFIGFVLIMTGILLFVGDRFVRPGNKTERSITFIDALIIGIAQAVALVPGLSRSGTTITVGKARGLSRDFSVKFSLLLSLPAVAGSTLLTIFKAVKAGIEWALIPKYLIGAFIAAFIGFFAIKLIHKLMRSDKFGVFAYYCWAVGIIVVVLSFILK
ncbi:MAG: undecaprenyl-diphosphate phosphatase [Oscillospiraceae bacterium]|nr:undecaprenyl-diphosphate phosphatase [Oscillospiraceae bacterium]